MFWFDKIPLKKNAGAYQERLSLLTIEEYKVFMLLREGFSTKECSQRLHMKHSDVKVHVKSIYSKLNVRSLSDLIIKYHENN